MTDYSSSPHPISRLYSRYLTPAEKRALRLVPSHNVSGEIHLLRFLAADFFKFQQSAPQDLASHMQALRTCTLLCEQLAVLVRACDQAHSPQSEMDDILSEAIAGLPMHESDPEEKS